MLWVIVPPRGGGRGWLPTFPVRQPQIPEPRPVRVVGGRGTPHSGREGTITQSFLDVTGPLPQAIGTARVAASPPRPSSNLQASAQAGAGGR